MDFITEPWSWWFSGICIAIIMFLLLLMSGKFGISSNLKTLYTICGADKTTSFFKFDWKA